MDEKIEIALKGGEFKRLMENRFCEVRAKYDLKKVDIEVLFFLATYKELNTPTDVYKSLGINRGHVSQAMDSLCNRQLIVPVPDENDRRSVHYVVCDNAKEIIDEVAIIKADMERQIFEGISPEEMDAYKKTTDKIFENIKKLLE